MSTASAVVLSRLAGTISDTSTAIVKTELRSGIIRISGYGSGAYTWQVYSGGNLVNAIWSQSIIPYDGAGCLLALVTIGNTATYYVLDIIGSQPCMTGAWKVTAFTGGSATCTVSVNGNSITAQKASAYTPTVGDIAVCIDLGNGKLLATQALSTYTPPYVAPTTSSVTPVPAGVTASTSTFVAQDSGTWTGAVGGWNSYYGTNVYSGSGYVPTSTGSWFYNGGTLGLADKTNINAIRFFLPARRVAGAYAAATVHFYAHTSQSRGTTEPTRAVGPFDVSIPWGWSGDWVALPLSFAATLKAGGGISIAGDPYVGFTGISGNGSSGTLSIDWSL